jgi:Domain of Unknown Function (DUF1259).
MRSPLSVITALFLAACATAPIPRMQPIHQANWTDVATALGKSGSVQPGEVYKVSFPRSDLDISVADVRVKPALALGSWAAFMQTGSDAMTMGDLVLTESEVNDVISALQAGGSTQPPVDLPTADLDRILGATGKANGGVYQFAVPRAERIVDHGMEIPPSAGMATAVNFQPTGNGRAAITGDFVLIAAEVNPVIRELRAGGIAVTALHSHMLTEEPPFLHALLGKRRRHETRRNAARGARPAEREAITTQERNDVIDDSLHHPRLVRRRIPMNAKHAEGLLPPSLVLTNWGADVELTGRSIGPTIHELFLLSLLYENIKIQDELLVLSDKFAEWFTDYDNRDLLRKLFDVGSLTILTHPLDAYPTEELRERAISRPLSTRAEYIERYGMKDAKPFKPSAAQNILYAEIDSLLLTRPASHQLVGTSAKSIDAQRDPTDDFIVMLSRMLGEARQRKWIRSKFKISGKVADGFLHFIENPQSVVDSNAAAGRVVKFVTRDDGTPRFNRALAFAATQLIQDHDDTIEGMQKLIQSCFAPIFALNENAAAQYGSALQEIMPLRKAPRRRKGETPLLSVEAAIDTSVQLPSIDRPRLCAGSVTPPR